MNLSFNLLLSKSRKRTASERRVRNRRTTGFRATRVWFIMDGRFFADGGIMPCLVTGSRRSGSPAPAPWASGPRATEAGHGEQRHPAQAHSAARAHLAACAGPAARADSSGRGAAQERGAAN